MSRGGLLNLLAARRGGCYGGARPYKYRPTAHMPNACLNPYQAFMKGWMNVKVKHGHTTQAKTKAAFKKGVAEYKRLRNRGEIHLKSEGGRHTSAKTAMDIGRRVATLSH